MKGNSGFTLIELVIVVVLIGFLAVTAIPKFLNLTDQAQQANIEGMAGGFSTAIMLANAQWESEARPKNASNQNVVNYGGNTLFLTVQGTNILPGYVVGLTDPDDDLAGLNAADCVDIWNNIFQQPPGATSLINTLNNDSTMDYFVSKSGSADESLCHYYLKETLSKGSDTGLFVAPSVDGDTTVGNSFVYKPANSHVVIYTNI